MCLENDIQVTFILINLWNLRIINSNFTCLVFFQYIVHTRSLKRGLPGRVNYHHQLEKMTSIPFYLTMTCRSLYIPTAVCDFGGISFKFTQASNVFFKAQGQNVPLTSLSFLNPIPGRKKLCSRNFFYSQTWV